MPPEPVLLFAYGNLARGDDALGPLLTEQLRADGVTRVCGHPAKFLTDYQIQVEHVLDMQDCAGVILIDAHARQSTPYRFESLQVRQDTHYTTHGMSPQTLLHIFRQTLQCNPPPSYMLSIAGESFDLGQDLSDYARNNLQLTLEFCKTSFNADDLVELDRFATG